MKAALKYTLLFLIFLILFVLPPAMLPFPAGPRGQTDLSPAALFILLAIDVSAIAYLIQRLNLRGLKLFLAVLLVFWGLQTFMTQIETWYFRDAMPAITDGVLMKLFLNPFITALAFIPLA